MEKPERLVTVSEQPYNAETPLSALNETLTSNDLFYVRNHFDVPQLNLSDWALNVGGAVEDARKFALDEIRSLPNRSLLVPLECAGNGRTTLDPLVSGTQWGLGAIAQAEFTGTSLSNILDLVHPAEQSKEVVFTGADRGEVRTGETTNYTRSLPLDIARHPDVLLVWEMNSQPLPRDHGFPLRLLVPGWYGMASVKWLQDIRLAAAPFEGFFQKDDYVYSESEALSEGAPVRDMRVRSLIVSHTDGETLPIGKHEFSGIAWGGQGGIAEVALSSDGGTTWLPADLEAPAGEYAWTGWKLSLEYTQPGPRSLILRAADGEGSRQPLAQFWNRGGYGNNLVHRITIHVD